MRRALPLAAVLLWMALPAVALAWDNETPTPSPSPTATPSPSATPSASPTPTATPTPVPTPTATVPETCCVPNTAMQTPGDWGLLLVLIGILIGSVALMVLGLRDDRERRRW